MHDAAVIGVRWLAVVACCVQALAACSAPARAPSPPAVSAPAADPRAPSFRLPGDVRPTGYRLELTVDPSAKQTSGSIAIEADVVKPVQAIWLHADPDVAITH